MRISDWSSDVCSSDLDGDAQGAERAGAGQFAKEDPARILVHHRGAAHRIGTQIIEDALHRRLPALKFAAAEPQLADVDIAAAGLRVVGDEQERKRLVEGKGVSVSVGQGGCRMIKKKKTD